MNKFQALNANTPEGADKTSSLENPLSASSDRLRGVFIIGTDTGVGKTFQACKLAEVLVGRGCQVGAYKPVLSGCVLREGELSGASDAELLRAATQSPHALHRICPQSFAAPAAPPVAAQLEGQQVNESLLLTGAEWWKERCEFLIVEGVGGAMSPISASMTVLDLATALQLPVIVVAANRLGAVSHVLLTIEALAVRKLPIVGVVLNELPDSQPLRNLERAARSTNAEVIGSFLAKASYADGDMRIVDSIESLV